MGAVNFLCIAFIAELIALWKLYISVNEKTRQYIDKLFQTRPYRKKINKHWKAEVNARLATQGAKNAGCQIRANRSTRLLILLRTANAELNDYS